MRVPGSSLRSARGAVLVHVAIALVVLLGFSAFAVDYGVLMVSRSQAQNSADAAALAGAVSMAFENFSDRSNSGPAKQTALRLSQTNFVWGAPPNVTVGTDITFPTCPDGSDSCIRVDAYRNAARGNPLPVFFGSVLGVTQQGVRATATAQAAIANATDCLKPWALADKWDEYQMPVEPEYPNDPDWDMNSTYDTYEGTNSEPDLYVPPDENSPGTGFRLWNADGSPADYGVQVRLKIGSAGDRISSGWFMALRLPGSSGASDYRYNIKHCEGTTYTIGQPLLIQTEPGNMVGPTRGGVERDGDSLVNQDPGAYWSTTGGPGGRGYVAGSAFGTSPRIVPIPVFNVDEYLLSDPNGMSTVIIRNLVGFFVEGMSGSDVLGRFCSIPGNLVSGATELNMQSSFMRTVRLVR